MRIERASALECGDLSPLWLLWRLVAKAAARKALRREEFECTTVFDGDKSPAESVDKSTHSKDSRPGVPAPSVEMK